jgi:hypothetical protein
MLKVVEAVHHPATITTLIENTFPPPPPLPIRSSHGMAVSNPNHLTPRNNKYLLHMFSSVIALLSVRVIGALVKLMARLVISPWLSCYLGRTLIWNVE